MNKIRNELKLDIIKAMVRLDTLDADEFMDRLDILDAMSLNEMMDELDVLRYEISITPACYR
jgi:hypothetical protein